MKSLLDTQQLLRQLQKVPLKRVQQGINVLLVIILAWLLAELSWQLVPAPAQQPIAPAGRVAANAAQSPGVITLSSLTGFSLFGKASAVPVKQATPVVTEAPKTQLNVKLTGLVAISAEPDQGSAIIESRGSEATYAVNDTIEGTNAVLKQVLADRVLLQQAGRYETLMLDGFEYTKIAQANAGLGRPEELQQDTAAMEVMPAVEPMEMQPLQVSDALGQRRDELIAEPMKLFDYIRVSPHRANGMLAGYRLMPGKDPSLFTQLGLQANDLAVEINGVALTDMQQAMNVLNELRDAKEAAIKVERDGEVREILLSLSQ